jgi:DNA-binding MarR family transcriptional regulator
VRSAGASAPLAAPDLPALGDLLGHLLRRSHLTAQRRFAEAFEGTRLSALQYALLCTIRDRPGIGHRALADAVAAAGSVVTTALKPLITAGLVLDPHDRNDARLRTYRLSARGVARLASLGERIVAAERRLASALTEAETAQLRTLLRRLSAGMPSPPP